jgi:tRNA (cytidine/uridine-2'-O-)-methyltransferase
MFLIDLKKEFAVRDVSPKTPPKQGEISGIPQENIIQCVMPLINLSLYQPDIPQNVGAAMRLCACLDIGLDIIEPCGFPWDDTRIRRAGMDYVTYASLTRHSSWADFRQAHADRRVILLTTKTSDSYLDFTYKKGDILLAGQESAGVPLLVHESCDARVTIPMAGGMRSLNVINACAMVLGEALRQVRQEKTLSRTYEL